MSTRGWENFTQADVAKRESQRAPKPSKYRNVRAQVGEERFDSKAEASYWLWLKARESAAEITELTRQVKFPLYAPLFDAVSHAVMGCVQVAEYIADFVYIENGVRHVVDKKGKRTAMYLLKRKWLELQDGIRIDEV